MSDAEPLVYSLDNDAAELAAEQVLQRLIWDLLDDSTTRQIYTNLIWEHVLVHEGGQPVKRSVKYPRCGAGARRCPPEDCGGIHGYAQLLEILASPQHPQHASMREWVGATYDPDAFEPRRVAFDDPQKRWAAAFER